MKIYLYNDSGRLTGSKDYENNLLPRNATLVPPPTDVPEGYYAYYDGNTWHVIFDHELKGVSYQELLVKIDEEYEEVKVKPIRFTPSTGEVEGLFAASKETIWGAMERLKFLADEDVITLNNGTWDTISPGYSLPFTYADLKGLWMAIFDRGAINYQVYKDHRDSLKAVFEDTSTTWVDVRNYQYKENWVE